MSIDNRYDFVLVFDVKDGNPNGDPDAGNLPRLDPETSQGLVTDVAIKRKIRNFVAMVHEYKRPYDIYVREKAVLGRSHVEAFKSCNISIGAEHRQSITAAQANVLQGLGLPLGICVEETPNGKFELIMAADFNKASVVDWIKENKLDVAIKKLLNEAIKHSNGRRPTQNESERGKQWLCENFFDIRTFGAVLSLKSAPNCGQVRGPVQLTFARSIDPIVPQEHSITRVAVATEAESEKQNGDNRTMGHKNTVPYGLYVAHGFVSCFLAKQTGFGEDDLKLLWQALSQMFEHDRSAARGEMTTRGLYVFKHDSKLGNAPANTLFERIGVTRKPGVSAPRRFEDYNISVDNEDMPSGVSLADMTNYGSTR